MEFKPPPIQEPPIHGYGRFPQTWLRWFGLIFSFLDGQEPIKLHTVTVATVPLASENASTMIYILDEVGGAIPAFSDGTNWRRVSDRAVVS